jgi:hypothetical protein
MKNLQCMTYEEVGKYMPGQKMNVAVGQDGKTTRKHIDILD